jgi:hypothetical protein
VVTEPALLLLWLDPESALLPELSLLELWSLWVDVESSVPESALLCEELVLAPSSLWVAVPVVDDEPVAAVVVAPPLPRAATASHAATNVASVAAMMRRRTVRRGCVMGGSGDCGMRRIVAALAQILLGDWYGAGKNRPADPYGASKVT